MKKKAALIAGLVLVLALIAIRLIFFRPIKDDYFALNFRSLQQVPPGFVVLRPTHFPFLHHADPLSFWAPGSRTNFWMVGRNATFADLLGTAYGQNPSRVIVPPDAPKTNFDFLVTINHEPRPRLQAAIRKKLGYRAELQLRAAEVLILKVINQNLPGMRISNADEKRMAYSDATRIKFIHMPASAIAALLNQFYDLSVVDKTGLTDSYDYSLPIAIVTPRSARDQTTLRAEANSMIKELGLALVPEMQPREVLVVKMTASTMSAPVDKSQSLIGPVNPGAEDGSEHWFHGMDGEGVLLTDDTDPATGDNDFTLENSSTNRQDHADWRSETFSMGAATNGTRALRFSFDYKLPGTVKDGDNLRVQLRFYDKTTNFIGQKEFWVGSKTQDSAMANYKTISTNGIIPPPGSWLADIVLSANLYAEDRWSSGIARFDNVLVTIPNASDSSPSSGGGQN